MNRTRTRTGVVLALVAGALMVGLTDAALAARTPASIKDARVTPLQSGNASYSGTVKSKKARCYKNRRIEIFHKGVLIGEAKTDDKGFFRTTGPLPPSGDKVTFKILPKRRCGVDEVEVTTP
jgi:hypothetical protein